MNDTQRLDSLVLNLDNNSNNPRQEKPFSNSGIWIAYIKESVKDWIPRINAKKQGMLNLAAKIILPPFIFISSILPSLASEGVDVLDYIKGKFSPTFNLYLKSLGELDKKETEFIDLLEKVPKDKQLYFAKEVYNKGFNESLIKDLQSIITIAEQYDFGFREVKWGMSPEDLKKTEESKLKFKDEATHEKIGHYINYFGEEAGIDCHLSYRFEDEKLSDVVLNTEVQHKDLNKHISDYNKWKEFLTDKYGKPIQDDMRWKNDKYKENPEKWGNAVRLQHMDYYVKWETPNTLIYLSLFGTEFANNQHMIILINHYMSKEFKKPKK